MGDDWRSRNVFTRTASNVYEGSGAKSAVEFVDANTADSNLRLLPGAAGAAIDFGRDIALNKVIDPLAGKAVKSVASYFMDHKLPAIKFYDDKESSYSTEISAKSAPAPAPTNRPIPKRMLELDTGNLVDISSWGSHTNVYCILSHAWRGQEIEYSFFQKVKEKKTKRKKLERLRDQKANDPNANDLERTVAEFQLSKYAYLAAPVELPPISKQSNEAETSHPWADSDVASLIAECNEEINTLVASFKFCSVSEVLEDAVITQLLITAFKRTESDDEATNTTKPNDILETHLWEGFEEFNTIVKLLKDVCFISQLETRLRDAANGQEVRTDGSIDAISVLRRLSSDTVQNFLDDSLDANIIDLDRESLIIDFEMRLRRGIERGETPEVISFLSKLKTALEKRRSAQKIVQSLRVGLKLFEEIWPRYSDKKVYKRYIWNDTCCINKSVVGEHQESLAMMGEWYSNAEFCVVHIDTPPDFTTPWDPLETWRAFRKNVPFVPTPQSFDEIVNPNWSTRYGYLSVWHVIHFTDLHYAVVGLCKSFL